MRWIRLTFVTISMLAACGSTISPGDVSSGFGDSQPLDAVRGERLDLAAVEVVAELPAPDLQSGDEVSAPDTPWVFDRTDYDPVHGWILLDSNPDAVKESIELAAEYGINHIQLSHDLIMNVEDVLGEDAATQKRIETLNMGISLAHQKGMKAYIWAHEFSGVGLEICYDPADPIWETRADAYRETFDLLPNLDGVILMFGSAPSPPWFSLCICDWCLDSYDGLPLVMPPPEERIRMVTEKLGEVIVNEQGKDLFVRTFVHEPAEIGWHNDGLAETKGVSFTGMHKGPVQDWQPYNPHHPSIGNVGPHPSVMELDLAGEYFGLGVLPWCAPSYYWYRLNHLWEHQGIGVVARIQRGSHTAIGTPNQINLLTVQRLLEDHETSLDAIWNEFIQDFYGLAPDGPGQEALKQILADTFPIRRKSHYALGIWALEKSSDFPDSLVMDQFNDRGKMPKWNSDWQGIWDSLNEPDRTTVLWLWQEGCEAVELASQSLDSFEEVSSSLDADAAADLLHRLTHQFLAARAWRAVDLFIWSHRVKTSETLIFEERDSWKAWARDELMKVRDEMVEAGLAGVAVASPERIQQFLDSIPSVIAEPVEPAGLRFSPIRFHWQEGVGWRASFATNQATQVVVDYGLELPNYGYSKTVFSPGAGVPVTMSLGGLEEDQRYVVRLRAAWGGTEYHGGDFWLVTGE
jgi:hypothetical protein